MSNTLNTLDELDVMLRKCDDATNDDALRRVFAEFRMEFSTDYLASLPSDPLSTDYHRAQMALYERISSRSYDLGCEHTPMDVASAVIRPFPYSTGSTTTAGDHFVVIGEFLRLLKLPPNAKILELGPGWGNLTLALAGLGHRVTAVDVEANFCQVIAQRASNAGLNIEVVNADFAWIESTDAQFDAVIFFECFHHASDHLRLLKSLHRVLKPKGRVYLGAEPILPDFPVPWGVRMDGQSLWSIRKFGWLELGYNQAYFRQALAETGWIGTEYAAPYPSSWELRRADEALELAVTDQRFGTTTGTRVANGIEIPKDKAGFALFGPYLALPDGRYTATLSFDSNHPVAGSASLDACVATGTKVLATRHVALPNDLDTTNAVSLEFQLPQHCTDLEIRLHHEVGTTARILRLDILAA